MKKILLLLSMLLVGYSMQLNAQSPACLAAGYLSTTTTLFQTSIDTSLQVPAAETWYKVLGKTDSSLFRITTSIAGHRFRLDKIEVYKGSNCASLTLLGKDSLESVSDSILLLPVGNHIATDTLFIRTTYITNTLCPSCPNTNLNFRLQMWYLKEVAPCPSCPLTSTCQLVCNGGFETYNTVTNYTANITSACGWVNLTTGSCDYFNTASPAGPVGVHCNLFGDETPALGSGNAYAGFGAYPANTYTFAPNAYAEYLATQLIAPVVAGQTYQVSFKLSAADMNGLAGNTIGICFYNALPASITGTDVPISTPIAGADFYPVPISGLSISGWTTYTLNVIPTANYQRMAIGAFTTSFSTVTTCTPGINGCSQYTCSPKFYTYIDDISVTPAIITHTVTGCAGLPRTLTSSIPGPWNWSWAGPGGLSATTQTVSTVFGTSWPSTPYVVTSVTPSGCGTKEYFYVSGMLPNEIISVSPTPDANASISACAGQPITFTASGLSNNTYTWYSSVVSPLLLPPPGSLYTPVGTGVNHAYTFPSSPLTQTVAVYGTAANGCGAVRNVTVTIIPSVTAAITGDLSMCAYSNNVDTYTATPQPSGSTYTWSVTCNGAGVPFTPAPNGQSITVDWSAYANGTFNGQVCLTVGAPGCSNSNACVQVMTCCMPSGEYIPVVGSQDPNAPTALSSTSLSNNNSYALSGYFTISGIASWTNIRLAMAPGAKITVPSGATLRLTTCHFFGCSQMWDGIYANGGLIQCLKRNLIEDALNGFVMQQNVTHNFSNVYFNRCHIGIDFRASGSANATTISSCVFTSRNFGLNNAGATMPISYLGNSGIPQNYPISNYINYLSALCLAPYQTSRAHIGVNIVNNAEVTVGAAQTASSTRNVFDNLLYGIHSSYSNVYVFNNLFIYIQENCNGVSGCTEPYQGVCPPGTAVCTSASGIAFVEPVPKFTKVAVPATGSTNYPNYFQQSQYGVYNSKNRDLDARDNEFTTIDQVGIYNALSSNYSSSLGCPSNAITITGNKLEGAQTGIYLNDNRNANMTIRLNTINWTNWSTVTIQQSVSGIIVNNAVVHTAGSLNIARNNIANLQKGITLTLQGYAGTGTTNRVLVQDNPIRFNQLQSSTVSVQHYGVGIFSSKRITVDGDGALGDVQRITTSAGTLNNSNTQRDLFNGVRIESSTESWVTDINIINIPAGIYAKGACATSDFWCNTFTSAYNGVYLDNATVGDQLNLATPYYHAATGNQWLSTTSSGSKIGGAASPAILWYYNSSAGVAFNPTPSPGVNPATVSFIVSDNTADACTYQMPQDPGGGDPNGRIAGNINQLNKTPSKALEESHDNTSPANARFLENEPELALYPVYLDSMGVEAAAIYNAAIITENDADEARKKVDEIHLRSWAQGLAEFTTADSAYLCWLTTQVPDSLGSAVYSAQVMVNGCYEELITARMIHIQKKQSRSSIESKGRIYPNPNDGQMQAEYSLKENESGLLEIFDLSGNKLSSYRLNSGPNSFVINENKLQPGIYLYKVIINGAETEVRKLVIVK
jgi:hypothetical protein